VLSNGRCNNPTIDEFPWRHRPAPLHGLQRNRQEYAMKKERYTHTTAAVYADADSAESAARALKAAQSDEIQLSILTPDSEDIEKAIEPETEATRDTVVRDSAIGGVAGTGAGAAVAGAATVVAPTLFVSSPVIGPLMALGYGAMIGGTVGAVRGLKLRHSELAGLVRDALKDGCCVVLVHAVDDAAMKRVEQIIDKSMAEETAHT
jgi:hypothetical protein